MGVRSCTMFEVYRFSARTMATITARLAAKRGFDGTNTPTTKIRIAEIWVVIPTSCSVARRSCQKKATSKRKYPPATM